MELSDDNIALARFVANAIGLNPAVTRHYDANKETTIDILSADDPLDSAVKFYCTVGLSDYPNLIDAETGPDVNIPVELLIGAEKNLDKVPDLLATCAFNVIENQLDCQYGAVFEDVISAYYPESEMRHIFFVRPFPWAEKLAQLQLKTKKPQFLLAVPISESELQYRAQHGAAELKELLFDEKKINPFDLNRSSVVLVE